MDTLLLLSKFHEKTLSRPGGIKIFFVQGGGKRMYMYTLPPLIDAVLSEERQFLG